MNYGKAVIGIRLMLLRDYLLADSNMSTPCDFLETI